MKYDLALVWFFLLESSNNLLLILLCFLSLLTSILGLNFIFLCSFLEMFLCSFALFIILGTEILEWFSLLEFIEERPIPLFLFVTTFICFILKSSFSGSTFWVLVFVSSWLGLDDSTNSWFCVPCPWVITSLFGFDCPICVSDDISIMLLWVEGSLFKWERWFKWAFAPLDVSGSFIFLFL